MGRLGILGRLAAVIFLTLLAIFAVLTGVSYVQQRGNSEDGVYLRELPSRVTGIVLLLDAAKPEARQLVLDATSGDDLKVDLAAAPPALAPTENEMPGIERILALKLNKRAGTDIIARVDTGKQQNRIGRLVALRRAEADLTIAVRLVDGQWTVVRTGGDLQFRLFGLPPGFWLAAAGFLVGGAALWSVSRETRSLRAVGMSVAAFEASAEPQPIPLEGAPEIKALIEAVNRMQQRIAALLKGRVVLLGGLSHDAKTYITRLRLRAEAIEDDTLRDKTIADLDDMAALIDDALSVARSSAAPSRVETVNLTQLLAALAGEAVTVSCEPGLAVSGDPFALKRAFANLAENAKRYGQRARIAARRSGRSVAATVDDDGPGIPAAERQAVFEPFYRLETSRNRATGGSGLGLAIVKQIVGAHGGSVAIGDAPSGGARLTVTLPLADQ